MGQPAYHSRNNGESMRVFEVISGQGHDLSPALDEEGKFDPQRLADHITDNFSDLLHAPASQAESWPDYEYEFSRTSMLGSELQPLRPGSRLRTVFLAIKSVAPEAMRIDLTKPDTAKDTYERVSKFVNADIKLGGQSIPRSVLLPISSVSESLVGKMYHLNHPVAQALVQLRQEYGGLIQANELSTLGAEVVFTTQETLIKDIYNRYIAEFRKIL